MTDPENLASNRAAPDDDPAAGRTANRYPEGWDESRVRRLLERYDAMSDEDALLEAEIALDRVTHTTIELPVDLLPEVRSLMARHRRSA